MGNGVNRYYGNDDYGKFSFTSSIVLGVTGSYAQCGLHYTEIGNASATMFVTHGLVCVEQ